VQYRPEIDGLRAIAVIIVMLLHCEFDFDGAESFAFGFIGVDIFFVISGYLITSLMLREWENSRDISFKSFYERRARRILPSLFLLLLICLPIAFKLLSSVNLQLFLDSALWSVFFSSNLYFISLGPESELGSPLVPLIHTWSLAVEEQFYLVFPLILLLALKYVRNLTLHLLLFLFVVSFISTEFVGNRSFEINYLGLPTRLWELLAGSILAYLEMEYGRIRHTTLNRVMPLLGLLLIVLYGYNFDGAGPVPNLTTILPILGTVLIIAFSDSGGLVGRALSARPMVGIGLISYSLYLWHLPVIKFFQTVDPQAGNLDRIGWIGISILLATVCYRWVEQPFRNPQVIQTRSFLIASTAMAAVIVLLCLFGLTTHLV
jgi:peptidoglycan/LPS O-acetylase OafA/YrhL